VCKVPHSSRPSDYFCLPLNLLEIVREGSCLQLCRKRRSGTELVLWANLKFSTIERRCTQRAVYVSGDLIRIVDVQGWSSFSARFLPSARRTRGDPCSTLGIMSSGMKRSCLEGE